MVQENINNFAHNLHGSSDHPTGYRYFLHISYIGTQYCGWQVQPNGQSVQSVIEETLRLLLRSEHILTQGCGRTDAGVHADNFFLHFTLPHEIEDTAQLIFRLNYALPWDIVAHGIYNVHERAHARFDAIERSYKYHIHQIKDPFIHLLSTFYPFPLDVHQMNEAAKMLVMKGDFASFCKTGGGQKTTICDVREARWDMTGHRLIFHITADRFLRNMVRAIVGTLIKVGRGKMTLDEFAGVIDSRNRALAGDSAHAQGLHLTKIKYPYQDTFLNQVHFQTTYDASVENFFMSHRKNKS